MARELSGDEAALCKGCHQPLRHAPIVLTVELPEGDETYSVPSWHAECIPEHLKSGQRGIRRKG